MQNKIGSLTKSQRKIYQKLINATVPKELAIRAVQNQGKNIYLLALSGKMGSGKDTIGRLLMDRLAKGNWVQISFASAIKKDINDILDICKNAKSEEAALSKILELKFPPISAKAAIELLFKESKKNSINAYERSPVIRKALQFWGKAVREEMGTDYWSNILLNQVATALAAETSILISDARFEHEITLCKELGFTTIRLNIDSKLQQNRLKNRDGVKTPKSLINDYSEIALDSYKGFDLTVYSNDPIDIDILVEQIKSGKV